MKLEPFPSDFEHRGKFVVWDKAWNRVGYSADQQYPGQQPVRYPEDASNFECFLGGYVRD